MILAVTVASISAGITRPAIAYYVRYTLESSMIYAAGLTSGFMIGRALTSIMGGVIGDLVPHRRWILAGLPILVSAGLIAIIPLIDNATLILLVMGLWGLLAGLAWPTAQVVTAYLDEKGGKALSYYFAAGSLGVAVGNKLFGTLNLSYIELIKLGAGLMLLASVLLIISSCCITWMPKSKLKHIKGSLLDKRVLFVLLSALVLGMMSGVLKEFFYIYSNEVYGIGREGLGNLLLIAGLGSVIAGLAAGYASDYYGVDKILFLVLSMTTLGGLLLGLEIRNYLALYTGYLLAAAGVRASMPLTRNARIVKRAGGTIVGISNALSNIGMVLSPLLAGYLYEHIAWKSIPFLAITVLLAGVILLYIILLITSKETENKM